MLPIDDIRERLAAAFRPQAAVGFDHVYQFRFGDGGAFHLVIRDGELEVLAGEHERPSVTFMFDAPRTALEVIEGDIDGMHAFMQGRIRTDGNLVLALQLGRLFGPPPPPPGDSGPE